MQLAMQGAAAPGATISSKAQRRAGLPVQRPFQHIRPARAVAVQASDSQGLFSSKSSLLGPAAPSQSGLSSLSGPGASTAKASNLPSLDDVPLESGVSAGGGGAGGRAGRLPRGCCIALWAAQGAAARGVRLRTPCTPAALRLRSGQPVVARGQAAPPGHGRRGANPHFVRRLHEIYSSASVVASASGAAGRGLHPAEGPA